ncbi:DUF87 domain-containing protein [Leisingera daeponensis]|uniref:DUF87 domain-containing protein n=1 Tax=Leisingera daeponensis TaxID=405746 RepID=A0ABS7NLK0_9RHOB|nr:DUF87 domain-containing protein [Leisingera daeponensis]MBY6142065.1 DUF87 domain-containing protein [Leisingera daeponensis]
MPGFTELRDFEAELVEGMDVPGQETTSEAGPVAEIARSYQPERSQPGHHENLLGFILNLSYDDVTIVTCDAWKRNCGGVPRNTLVVVRLAPTRVSRAEGKACDRLIMVRITDSIPTPIDSDIKQTVFELHRSQANIDPISDKEFQWSALKGRIVGTFYDKAAEEGHLEIGFGPDVDTFFAPHLYEVYVPIRDHLSEMLNAFSEAPDPLQIGTLRYTETPSIVTQGHVEIKIDPSDFTGKTYGHRTALFGKTRFGKSNTMKVVADTVLTGGRAGQIIFDPSGEYTYWNEQDDGCLAARYPKKCVRYSLSPMPRESDKRSGLPEPSSLKVDFYANPDVGKSLIFSLWESEYGSSIPDYIAPAREWEPEPLASAPTLASDQSGYKRYWRTMGIWYSILAEAGFPPPTGNIWVDFRKDVKDQLLADEQLKQTIEGADGKMKNMLPYRVAANVWKRVAEIHADASASDRRKLFPASSTTGDPYFDPTAAGLLAILNGAARGASGPKKFTRFKEYHAVGGANVFTKVIEEAHSGKTVFLDLSMGDEKVRKAIAERIARSLLASQMRRFNEGALGTDMVILYFEEAHILFPSDDRGLGDNVYNKLAKEGAKFNISLVYATQSISTLSPDLVKNTENFIVTHLDDDREVRELQHKRAFRDIAADVERITSKGYVRLKTLSMPFALPVQIRKFSGAPDPSRED